MEHLGICLNILESRFCVFVALTLILTSCYGVFKDEDSKKNQNRSTKRRMQLELKCVSPSPPPLIKRNHQVYIQTESYLVECPRKLVNG